MRVQQFPAPGEKVSASDFIVTGGGCAANAAVAVARLKGRTAFAGPLGDMGDAVSNRIVTDLEAEGIDCGHVVRVNGATASVSLILLDAQGEKSIATRRGKGLNDALPADPATLAADADAVLIDNRFPDFAMAVCKPAQARGIPIVIDLDQTTKLDHLLLALGTHVIASSEAFYGTTGTRDFAAGLDMLAVHNKGFLAVTDGPNGVYWREDGALRHMPAFTVDAVDTLGAGDAFHGAFALAIAEGRDLLSAMRFSCATAGLKCTRFGGAAGAPARDEVEAFLRERTG